MQEQIKIAFEGFDLPGKLEKSEVFGNGHINETYRISAGGQLFIMQKINTNVFPDAEKLMDNFAAVTAHIGKKIAARKAVNPAENERTLTLVHAKDGKNLCKLDDGSVFRCYVYVDQAHSVEIPETAEQSYEAARAFGGFQAELADLPVRVNETIPHFHDTPQRLRNLEKAVKADAAGRLKLVSKELDFIRERAEDCALFSKETAAGLLHERITHNDTKINNVLFDDKTMKACCVIDLDTVMPGLPHFDFGDLMRTGIGTAAEDETDLAKVGVRMDLFEALLRGYLSGTGNMLNAREKELLPFAGKIITLETAIRFLTDYLEGDHYFRIHRPEHNLDRCRSQIALVAAIEKLLPQMNALCAGL